MLFKLLGLPFTLPVAGLRFCMQQIADLADAELNDEGVIREQLLLLQVQLEDGDISEEEFAEQEAVLLARLRDIRARRQQEAQARADELRAELAEGARRRVVVEGPFGNDAQT